MNLKTDLQDFSSQLGFRARPLESIESVKALALVQMNWPCVDAEAWRRIVKARLDQALDQSVWVAIEDLRAYVHALFFCRLIQGDLRGSVLRISDMVTAELPGPSILRVAADCIAFLAWRRRASALEVEIEAAQDPGFLSAIEEQLRDAGWRMSVRRVFRFHRSLH